MAGMSDGLFDSTVMAPTLTDAERNIRDKFVTEYIKDRNEYKATIRMGYLHSVATSYSQIFMNCTYVQKRISDTMFEHQEHFTKDKADAFVKNTIAQVMTSGGNKERVTAANLWADIYGLKAAAKQNIQHGIASGVMLVPAISNIDAWEAEAVASQFALVDDTRNG